MTPDQAKEIIETIPNVFWRQLNQTQAEALDIAIASLNGDPCIFCSNYEVCEPWKESPYNRGY